MNKKELRKLKAGNIDFIAEMEENDTGEYVTFVDHIAKIEQLKQTHSDIKKH